MVFRQKLSRWSGWTITPAVISGVLLAGLAAGPVQATSTFGSAVIFTDRTCSGTPDVTCVLSNPKNQVISGGMGQSVSSSVDWHSINNLETANAGAYVVFGGDYLPIAGVRNQSGLANRIGATVSSFRSYQYLGAPAFDLALKGNLHFTNSHDGPQIDGYGDGTLNVSFGILKISDIDSYGPRTTATDIILNNTINFPRCSTGAIAAGNFSSLGLSGINSRTISLSNGCDGGRIRINSGDSFVIVSTLQAISNRGGFVSAMETFSVEYDAENSFLAGTDIRVDPSIFASIDGAVPEPATWAFLIMGFGMTGAILRRRRQPSLSLHGTFVARNLFS